MYSFELSPSDGVSVSPLTPSKMFLLFFQKQLSNKTSPPLRLHIKITKSTQYIYTFGAAQIIKTSFIHIKELVHSRKNLYLMAHTSISGF